MAIATRGRSLTDAGVHSVAGNFGTLIVGTVVNKQPVAGDVADSVLVGGNLDTAAIHGALSGGDPARIFENVQGVNSAAKDG